MATREDLAVLAAEFSGGAPGAIVLLKIGRMKLPKKILSGPGIAS